jgi:hypothetical protein
MTSLLVLLLSQTAPQWGCSTEPVVSGAEGGAVEWAAVPLDRGSSPVEQARIDAREKLQRRFCLGRPNSCGASLREFMNPGPSAELSDKACAAVYVSKESLDAWRLRSATREFNDELIPRVVKLLSQVATPNMTVSVGLVEDRVLDALQKPGRARWLRDQLEKAVTESQARTDGSSPLALTATIEQLSTSERLELTLALATPSGRLTDSFSFSPLVVGLERVEVAPRSGPRVATVALFPFEASGSTWLPTQLNDLLRLVQLESGALLEPEGYAVEPIIVPSLGRCEDRCASETARAMGATHFVTGTITSEGAQTTVYLLLREVRSLAQKGSVRLEGSGGRDLKVSFLAQRERLFSTMVSEIRHQRAPHPLRVASWVGLGVGAGAAAFGGVLRGVALSLFNGNVRSMEGGFTTNSVTEVTASSANSLVMISNVLFIVGGSLAALGLLGVFLAPATNGLGLE